MKNLLTKLRTTFPLVRRKTMVNALEVQLQAQRDIRDQSTNSLTRRHDEELRKERQRIDEVLDRWLKIDFARPHNEGTNPFGERYRIMLEFDPKSVTGWPRGHLDQIARAVGRKVEYEIATSKFVDKANANRDRYGY